MGAYLREVICKNDFLRGAYSRISTLRRTDHGSPRTDWCSKAYLHYNRSYCRRVRKLIKIWNGRNILNMSRQKLREQSDS